MNDQPNQVNNLKKLEQVLFFLTLLFLPTQLGRHFWPQFSFIYSIRIDYLSPTIYFWDLLVLFLILTHLAVSYLNKSRFYVNKKAIIIFTIFLITQILSITFSLNPEASLVRLKDYFFAILFGLYLASANYSKIKKTLIVGLLGAVIGSSFLGIGQFLLGHSLGFWVLGERSFSVTTPLISKFNFYDRVFLRPYATFSHPNLFCAFMIVTLPLFLTGIGNSLYGFKSMLGLLVLSTVFITFSRPGLIIAFIYAAIFFRKYWKLAVLLATITAPLILVRFTSILTFDQLAVMRRQELSEFALKIFFEHPVTGVGLNNFINMLAGSEILVGTSRFLQPVHNIFLLSLSETGGLGFLGFIFMFYCALIQNLKNQSAFRKGLLSSLFMVIFLGLFDHYFLTLPQGQRLLFMIIGLSFANNHLKA